MTTRKLVKPRKFVVGQKYECRSACDQDCIWTFEIVRRTAKSIWIKGTDGEVIRKTIRLGRGAEYEYVRPLGSYSMAPFLRAS